MADLIFTAFDKVGFVYDCLSDSMITTARTRMAGLTSMSSSLLPTALPPVVPLTRNCS